MRPAFVFAFLLSLVAGCAQFPEVEQATSADIEAAPYPALVPVEEVLDEDAPRLDDTSEAVLQGSVDRLKRRAADLRTSPSE
jgi:hypothetical protein